MSVINDFDDYIEENFPKLHKGWDKSEIRLTASRQRVGNDTDGYGYEKTITVALFNKPAEDAQPGLPVPAYATFVVDEPNDRLVKTFWVDDNGPDEATD